MPIAADIYYQVFGETLENTHKVVLIHGAGENHLYWSAEIRRLPGCRVYALDLPGHGRSTCDIQTSVKAYSENVNDWQCTLNLEPAFYVGHSLGGAIAMQLALLSPDRVLGLGLIGSSARLPVNPVLLESIADPATFPKAIEMLIRWSFSKQSPARLRELAAMRMTETPGKVYSADFLACQGFDLTGRLSEIRCPVLVICGADDRMTPPGQAQFLAAHLPNAQLEIIPDAGHMVMLEQPRTIAQRLAAFLDIIPA